MFFRIYLEIILFVFCSLNAWSSSKTVTVPFEASSWPTGNDVTPMSDKVFVILKSITLSEISTTSLGDISIRSKVESNLFMVSTTIRIPRIYSNSLYVVPPEISFKKDSGDVRSVTKPELLVIDSDPKDQPYSGVKV